MTTDKDRLKSVGSRTSQSVPWQPTCGSRSTIAAVYGEALS